MFNTPFEKDEFKKTQIFSNTLNVLLKSGKPLLSSIVWLNDNFENICEISDSDAEIYENIFDEFKIKYK